MCSIFSFQDGKGEVKEFVDRRPLTSDELRIKAEEAGLLRKQVEARKLTVIITCPRCHKRTEVCYDDWCKSKLPGTPALQRYLCTEPLCEGKEFIYHKMGNE